MSKRSKRKGYRAEREIVQLHKTYGVNAVRMPLSGALGGDLSGDVHIEGVGRAEVKARANGQGFKTLEGWLGKNDLLFLRRDRQAPMVVLPWSTYIKLAKSGKQKERA